MAPPGTPHEYLTMSPLPPDASGIAGPIGLGFRVPCLVVSPFSRGGLVCSDTFDHTSLLRLLETRFGVEVPNLSAWRRATVGDLTSALNLAAAPNPSVPSLPSVSVGDPEVARECGPTFAQATANQSPLSVGNDPPYALPPTQTMPTQEPGAARHVGGTFTILSTATSGRHTVELALKVPEAGHLSAKATFTDRRARRGILFGAASAQPSHPGTITMTIHPGRKAAQALHAGQTLNTAVAVTFQAAGCLPPQTHRVQVRVG